MVEWDHVPLGYLSHPHATVLKIPLTLIGIVTICQGVTKSFSGLVACRFLLGLFEAGFMPGELVYPSVKKSCAEVRYRLYLLDRNVLQAT